MKNKGRTEKLCEHHSLGNHTQDTEEASCFFSSPIKWDSCPKGRDERGEGDVRADEEERDLDSSIHKYFKFNQSAVQHYSLKPTPSQDASQKIKIYMPDALSDSHPCPTPRTPKGLSSWLVAIYKSDVCVIFITEKHPTF